MIINRMNRIVSSLFILFFSVVCSAAKIQRLDTLSLEELDEKSSSFIFFISQHCSICEKQMEILKKCDFHKKEIKIFLLGTSEEKLRKYAKRLKTPFSIFWSNSEVEKKFNFNKKTPSSFYMSNGQVITLAEGLINCENISAYTKNE